MDKKVLFDEQTGQVWRLLEVVEKATREKILVQVWAHFVKEETDLAKSIHPDRGGAMTVVDRVGLEQYSWRVLWIYTKAVLCNGHKHMGIFRIN